MHIGDDIIHRGSFWLAAKRCNCRSRIGDQNWQIASTWLRRDPPGSLSRNTLISVNNLNSQESAPNIQIERVARVTREQYAQHQKMR